MSDKFPEREESNPSNFQVEDVLHPWASSPPRANSDSNPVGEASPHLLDSQLAKQIYNEFFDKVNAGLASQLDHVALLAQINNALSRIVDQNRYTLNEAEQRRLAREILSDMVGVGPLDDLMKDPEISDILVNGHTSIYVERAGHIEKTDCTFRDEEHLLAVARRIAITAGRRIDESSPMLDTRLKDGSRINIITPPLTIRGTVLSIRKFPENAVTLGHLVKSGSLSYEMYNFLIAAVQARLNILISGGTGSGKTTLLNALSAYMAEAERVVTIEDAAELILQNSHIISLETRQKNVEGEGEVTQRELLRNALRMRPDRIVIGEVRGAEAHEMLQAMNTGHDGSMSTIHANSCRDSLVRLEDLVLTHHSSLQAQSVRRQIVSSLDLLIHVRRDEKGRRCVSKISEVVSLEGDVIVLQDIFELATNTDQHLPEQEPSGHVRIPVPFHSLAKMKARGIDPLQSGGQ